MAVSPASIPLTLLLGVLVALTAFGMHMFLPPVPVIAQAFGAEPGAAPLSPFPQMAGAASSLLGALFGGIAFLCEQLWFSKTAHG